MNEFTFKADARNITRTNRAEMIKQINLHNNAAFEKVVRGPFTIWGYTRATVGYQFAATKFAAESVARVTNHDVRQIGEGRWIAIRPDAHFAS